MLTLSSSPSQGRIDADRRSRVKPSRYLKYLGNVDVDLHCRPHTVGNSVPLLLALNDTSRNAYRKPSPSNKACIHTKIQKTVSWLTIKSGSPTLAPTAKAPAAGTCLSLIVQSSYLTRLSLNGKGFFALRMLTICVIAVSTATGRNPESSASTASTCAVKHSERTPRT